MAYSAYVVATGRRPGVYDNWLEASWQLKGVKEPRWKGYDTLHEARAAWQDMKRKGYIEAVPLPNDNSDDTDDEDVSFAPHAGRAARDGAIHSPRHTHSTRPHPAAADRQTYASPRTQPQQPRDTHNGCRRDGEDYVHRLNEVIGGIDGILLSAGRSPRSDNDRGSRTHHSSSGSARSETRQREQRRHDEGTPDVRRGETREEGPRRSNGSSGPSSNVTNIEDGESPLMHRRRRTEREAAGTPISIQFPDGTSRRVILLDEVPDDPLPNGQNQSTSRDRQAPSRSRSGHAALRSSASSSSASTTSSRATSRSSHASARQSMHSPTTRHSPPHSAVHTEPELVPTEPNTPAPASVPLLQSRPDPHRPEDACIQGHPGEHHTSCPNFIRWLATIHAPLQSSVNRDRLARTRSEPAPSSGSRSSSSSSRAPIRADNITSLSPHISVAGLQREYSSGPAGVTAPSSPRGSQARSGSSNALGLSPRTLQRPASGVDEREDPRSPIVHGAPVSRAASASSPRRHRPSPGNHSIESRLVDSGI